MRQQINFDKNWYFHKGDIHREQPKTKGPIYTSSKTESMKWGPACIFYKDSPQTYNRSMEYNSEKWVEVNLPHDYVIDDEIDKNENEALGFFKYENAWYRKHFTLENEDKDKRITLLFEGVATRCTVYLNGCELYNNNSGYNSFSVDITDYVKFGEDNVLAVYVRYHHNEGWWYQGGGIYRHVWLVKTEKVAIDLYGVFIRARKNENNWSVLVDTCVLNDTNVDAPVKAVTTLLDKQEKPVLCIYGESSICAGETGVIKYSGEIADPMIWDIDNPELYTVKTDIYVEENLMDTVYDRFGFRDFAFTSEGFFLNGKKVFINGMCGHGDFGLTGKAVPDNVLRHKARMLKEMGCNGYRTTHYPQTAAFMDALDELGFIVMDETRWFMSTKDGLSQLEMLIKRDRNRPSVFMWSLSNEEPHHLTETGRRIHKKMARLVKKLDPTRPVTSAVSDSPDKATVYEDMDVVGINYNHQLYDVVRKQYPEKSIYASECCASATTRGWYEEDDAIRGYLNAYDHDSTKWFIGRENYMQTVLKSPWLAGFYQWIAFEHRGEALWPRLCSQAGVIDLFLQKKDAYYQNQSFFLKTPMIHLMPHWNWQHKQGEIINVWAYTNCEEAELFLNNKSLGKKQVEKFKHVEWNVPFEKGELKVVGYIDNKEAASDIKTTSLKAEKLMLKLENPLDIKADCGDMALFTCYAVDKFGIEVPDAAPTVSFISNKNGKIRGTGSDVSDHTPVTSLERKMRAGRILVGVEVLEEGKLTLTARSEGLETGYITVDIK